MVSVSGPGYHLELNAANLAAWSSVSSSRIVSYFPINTHGRRTSYAGRIRARPVWPESGCIAHGQLVAELTGQQAILSSNRNLHARVGLTIML